MIPVPLKPVAKKKNNYKIVRVRENGKMVSKLIRKGTKYTPQDSTERKIRESRQYKRLRQREKHKYALRLTKSPLFAAFARALAPEKPLTLTEWSDENRQLSGVASHEEGQWRTSRFPFLKRIQDLLSSHDPTQQVVVMKGAQLGFTELALNWMYYTVEYSPAPMLYVQKTIEDVRVFVKQRFDPGTETMPGIGERIGNPANGKRGRSGGASVRTKMFPGGMLRFGGANSASSLRSMPIQNLCLDEEDAYELDIQSEGSPSELAIVRTRNFPNRKVYRLSTPTLKETSVIEPLFEQGTKERFYVPCPHCQNMDWIRWSNIKYETGKSKFNPTKVYLVCEHCKEHIEEHHKTWMLTNGKWVAEEPDAEYPSFHISSLYSPYGFYSWKDAVKTWIKATHNHDDALLKTFINTVLGETWSEESVVVKASRLEERKMEYDAEVPKEVVVLTCGADVQKDRIEMEVVGFGKNLESWGIDYKVFLGDTERSEVWKQFDMALLKQYQHGTGQMIPIAITGVDSGFRTKVVYEFCKLRFHRNIFPVKGDSGWGKGYLDRPRAPNKYGVYAFRLFVDEIKSKIYSNLLIDEPGPGYCNFPKTSIYDTNYFRQLTSERLDRVYKNGRYRLEWVLPKGRRNEALDARAYAIGALNIMSPNFDALQVNQIIAPIMTPPKSNRKKVHHNSQF